MSANSVFLDTNVLLYLLSGDDSKAGQAEILLLDGGVISVQVLNEFASVANRKFSMSLSEIREALDVLRSTCTVEPLTMVAHDQGLNVAERYGFAIYDSMIIGSALTAGCGVLLSEDFQDGQVIEGQLTIRNPFRLEK